MGNEGILYTVPLLTNEQGIVISEDCVEPVSFGIQSTFFSYSLFVSPMDILKSQSVGNVYYQLETGVDDDALFINDLNEVACTIEKCNKRISCVEPERSAGGPGNRPIGARDAARNTEMCLGPYATCTTIQPHTGHNTRVSRQSSSRPRPKD